METRWELALRLQMTPGLGLRRLRVLVQALGGVEGVVATSTSTWREVLGVRLGSALGLEPAGWRDAVQRVRAWLQVPDDGLRKAVLTWGDAGYPAGLTDLADPPLVLLVTDAREGPDWLWPMAVAVVGSRDATPAGVALARQWSTELADAGCCVLSGLAHGIDAAAHAGALAARQGDCVTMAVMGTGPDRVYPPSHGPLKARLVQRGRWVTEFLPGEPARRAHFPMRNRLLAALSHGVVVVEADRGSGSLITAGFALELGREVMAVPGAVRSPLSRGCHDLLRQGATLVSEATDVLTALGGPMPVAPARAGTQGSAELPLEGGVFDGLGVRLRDAMRAGEAVTVEWLQAEVGVAMPALRACLQWLELQGRVARLAGDRVQWLAQGP